MSQETELDDLDLDKLLDDEDFLEDFDFEEPVVDSGLQTGEEMPSGGGSSGTVVSPAVESVVPPGDSTTVDDAESSAVRPFLKKILFPVSIVLAVMLLILQIYAAREIFFPKPHISSMTKRVVIAEVITHNLAENIDKAAEEEPPQTDIITFDFHYPLYSLAGLKILGVDVQLVFPPHNPSPLSAEQIEQLKKAMHDSLGQAVAGRMLEELGEYDDFFIEFLRESIASTLKQWHLPPATIRLEGLMVH
ncbi:MAG: hypothetical protein U9P07_12460 [Pseudomonadota bacterium]|nr:hypothetical protein [Pseudomonadota bacterium]